jgi:hypothetical protein
MVTSARRRLTLFDLLILTGATAVGFSLVRVSIGGIASRPLARSAGALATSYITAAQTYAACLLASWSPALFVLGLRAPRRPFRRIAREPGFVACAAATAGLALYSAVCLTQYAVGKLQLDPATVSRITGAFTNYGSLMVAGAWLSLALGSRWRPESNWIGCAGRALGIAWIGLFLLGWLRVFTF